ncbi:MULTISPECIES: GTP cyclohydrolase II [unclassified Methylophaga]|uniref:GTP cyclohydrolase II n=1 Tax=unclassified Methylophaga TaxID=2629249 RepID=UPI00259CF0A7|nr:MULTISPECIES: GTP cyclohydrolase II [unclassified Methylophaga]
MNSNRPKLFSVLLRRINHCFRSAKDVSAVTIRTTVQLPIILNDGSEAMAEMYSFSGFVDGKEHFALKLGRPDPTHPLVRIHSECVTGDALGSARCDCGPQLQEALSLFNKEGGYLLYLRQEGRGIGLYEKLDAYRLQEQGHDTFTANLELGHNVDERDYQAAADILNALKLNQIMLMTNNPDKRQQLEKAGIQVHGTRPTGVFANRHNHGYLTSKIHRGNHQISIDELLRKP